MGDFVERLGIDRKEVRHRFGSFWAVFSPSIFATTGPIGRSKYICARFKQKHANEYRQARAYALGRGSEGTGEALGKLGGTLGPLCAALAPLLHPLLCRGAQGGWVLPMTPSLWGQRKGWLGIRLPKGAPLNVAGRVGVGTRIWFRANGQAAGP